MAADRPTLLEADRLARLQLIRSENIGPITYRQLLMRFGSAQAALDALPELARRGGGRGIRIASRDEAAREAAAVERFGGRHLFLGLTPYPALLAQIEDAPPVISVKGHIALLDRPSVAIVGARNASAAAARFARGLAAELADEGLIVVSGLARGIDTAAHAGSLAGGTVAVRRGWARYRLPAGESGALRQHLCARSGGCRAADGDRAAGPALSTAQPHHCRADSRNSGGGSRAQVWIADYG